MLLTDNGNIEDTPVNDILPVNPGSGAIPVPVIEIPEPVIAKQPRNQHLKVEEPKNKQFGGRATESEARRINNAMLANNQKDIVRLMLFAIDLLEKDVFSSFKTKW